MRASFGEVRRLSRAPAKRFGGCFQVPSPGGGLGRQLRTFSGWLWGVLTSPRLGRWRRVGSLCPVLKHGPRSARGLRVFGRRPGVCRDGGVNPERRSESECRAIGRCESPPETEGASRTEPYGHAVAGFEWERACCDPKDGELCPSRAKPGETLVEARSGSDVQIDRETWV